jgi:ribose 5-phosphate isomerase A
MTSAPINSAALMADQLKKAVALAAIQELTPGSVVGVGTGSTVNHFIDALAAHPGLATAAISSSVASTNKLQAYGIEVLDLNEALARGLVLDVYVDGADEINDQFEMIKGGGAALTREKIVAAAFKRFVCIADASKQVKVLGKFALPVEVIPMARELVAKRLATLGGTPTWRQSVVTDNGNHILDVAGLAITNAPALESTINQWPGVVTVGLFAQVPADIALIGTPAGVVRLVRNQG